MKQKGYIFLILTFFIWGSLYVAAKYAMETIPPIVVLMLRYLLSVAVLYFIMKKRGFKKIKSGHKKAFFAIGFLGYFGGITCQLIGTHLLDASVASLINSLNPVVIPIIAAIFLNERLNLKIGISIVLSVIGVYIILGVGGGTISFWGIVINILSLLMWSGSCCIVRGISADYDPIQVTLYAMAIALIFAVPASIIDIAFFESISFSLSAVLAILYIAFICTALSHVLWNESLKLLPATTCSLFYPLQPLTSAALGILILHEKLTLSFAIGTVIICAGILLVVIEPKKK